MQRLKGDKVDILAWANITEIESGAIDQLKRVTGLPWVFHHVAVMPDVHVGKGATVGSVIAMKDAVSPAAVGVDIGCGMAAVQTNLSASDLPDSLKQIRMRLEDLIPVGFNEHSSSVNRYEDKKFWNEFKDLDPKVQDLHGKARKQLGSLGGGNHFIELCLDTEQRVWLMLHSGSRNIGKTLAEIHMARAQKLAHNRMLPDRDLAVFLAGTPEMAAYRHDLFWAQRYARSNREVMLGLYKKAMQEFFPQAEFGEEIHCHHNYVSEENHFGEDVLVTRKGAVRAREGDMGIIPGSMGARSFIVRGKGNVDSFTSCSHGAG
ncbi:MAG TPA: RtcB family protein, partial [Kofleriaceae bacterium]